MQPKTTLRAANRAARAAHMRSQSALGGHLGQTWRLRALRRPSGCHFGPLGARFWPLRGSILEGARGPPRSVQEALGKPCWENVESFFTLAATWGKPVTQVPPAGLQDAISAPSGLDVGPCGSRFWRAPQARPGTSRKLWRIHAGTMLNLYFHPCPATRRPSGRHCGPLGARLWPAHQESAVGAQPLDFLFWKTCLVRWFAFFFLRFPDCVSFLFVVS